MQPINHESIEMGAFLAASPPPAHVAHVGLRTIEIDPEFRALIPPLQPDERAQLEANIIAEGCRDPLVLWKGIVIDGHNRLEICHRLGIEYRTVEIVLTSRAHVLLWIAENQLGRRNLSEDQRTIIALEVAKRRAALGRDEQLQKARAQRGKPNPSVADTVSATTRDRSKDARPAVARAARVPERKLRAAAEIEKKLGPKAAEILSQIRAGETTIRKVKSEIRRAERIQKATALAAPPPLSSIVRRFPVIYADPPWRYAHLESESRAIENQYPTMDLAEICALEVASTATADAVLFLWATNPKLQEALSVLQAWGFEYRTNLVWVKDKIGMGYYLRQQHELLLIARRGDLPMPEPFCRPSSVLSAKRGPHSEKPEEIYGLIERMYPELPKLELFARKVRDGWSQWGNQMECPNAAAV